MKKLYSPIKPYNTGKLKVSGIHNIYFEETGNPKGQPIVVLHGGPGSASKAKYRRYFNPKKYRIILFDQRGCGQSTPLGEIRENTTQDLVADIEKIRQHLQIEKWHVYGFSWGSTLALAYTETHTDKVSALMVGGIFTMTKWELNWLHNKDAQIFYPDAWEIYSKNLSKKQSSNLIDVFYKKIFSKNKNIRDRAIKDFFYWDKFRMDLIPDAEYHKGRVTKKDIASAQIYFHYAKHFGFLKEKQLLKNADKLKNIPGVILHGRYDMVCPLITAWNLHKAWPKADFEIIEATGHHTTEANKIATVIKYTDKLVKYK